MIIEEPSFSVTCNDTLNSMDNSVSVDCFSSGGDIETLNCTFDNSSRSEDCCMFQPIKNSLNFETFISISS